MNKLKKVISEYGHWDGLSQYIDRIEAYNETDFSQAFGNCKTLLESVGKEICNKRGKELASNPSMNSVVRSAFSSMGFTNSTIIQQISKSLGTLAQNIGELRNEIDPNAHGKTMEELRLRNSRVDILTREFLIDTVETVSVLLIRTFETQESRTPTEKLIDSLAYLESEDFNEYLDDSFGEFSMGKLSYPASEILFNVDKQAYVTEYKIFNDLENEDEDQAEMQEQESVKVELSTKVQEVKEPILSVNLNEFPDQERAVKLESPSKDLKSDGKHKKGHSSANQQELNVLQKFIRWIISLFNK